MKAKLFFVILFAGMINVIAVASPGSVPGIKQDSIYWKAIKYYEQEEYFSALLLFEHLLLTDQYNAEINYYAGMCYFNLNKTKIAKWHLSIAASDNCCRLKILLLTRCDLECNDFISYNN